MAKNNKVVIKFLADTDAMRKGIDKVNGQLGKFGKSVKNFGLTFAAAFSAKAIVDFAGESIKAASDLEESISKVGAVFDDNAINIQNWAKDSSTAFGLSQQAALEAAGTFGNLFTAFGVGVPEAEKMSTALVELAADLASFNNTSIEQAITALRSGLSGETEPLKRFGVALNQAAIEAKALELGLVGAGEQLTQAAKTQAIFALVMEQTATAQGDFQRTSDGLANTMRQLSAAVDDAKAKIGRGLLAAVQSATDAAGGGEGLAGTIDDVATEFELLGLGIASIIDKLDELADKTEDTKEEEKGLERQTRSLWKAFLSGGDPLVGTGVLLQTIAYNLGVTEDQSLSTLEAQALLEAGYKANARAAKENAEAQFELANAYDAVLRSLGNLPNDKILRAERQQDSFLRQFNDGDLVWRKARQEAADYADSLDDLTRSTGGASSALKDTTDKIKEQEEAMRKAFVTSVKEQLQAAEAEFRTWRDKVVGYVDLGSAWDEANDADARLAKLQKDLAKLDATSPDKRAADFDARRAELVAQIEEAGLEAGKSWLDKFAEQVQQASGFAQQLGDLKNSELNKTLVSQIAALGPEAGSELATEILGSPNKAGIIGTLNANQKVVEDAGLNLGNQMISDMGVVGYEGATQFLFGYANGQDGNDGFVPTIKSNSKKVKKQIKKALKTDVEVVVRYVPDTSALANAPGGMGVVRSLQGFERLNGSKWRDRVR